MNCNNLINCCSPGLLGTDRVLPAVYLFMFDLYIQVSNNYGAS